MSDFQPLFLNNFTTIFLSSHPLVTSSHLGRSIDVLLQSNGLVANVLHVGDELSGHLLQHLFSEVTSGHSLVELHELDDVARRSLSTAVMETTTVAIKLFHGTEVGVANSHDDDGAGHAGKLADQVLRLAHVVDGTVRQDQQDLVSIGAHRRGDIVPELGQQRGEECWTTKSDLALRLLVHSHDVLNSIDIRVSSISIHCEAVAHAIDA